MPSSSPRASWEQHPFCLFEGSSAGSMVMSLGSFLKCNEGIACCKWKCQTLSNCQTVKCKLELDRIFHKIALQYMRSETNVFQSSVHDIAGIPLPHCKYLQKYPGIEQNNRAQFFGRPLAHRFPLRVCKTIDLNVREGPAILGQGDVDTSEHLRLWERAAILWQNVCGKTFKLNWEVIWDASMKYQTCLGSI